MASRALSRASCLRVDQKKVQSGASSSESSVEKLHAQFSKLPREDVCISICTYVPLCDIYAHLTLGCTKATHIS
ncbi:hypothetical protein V5799_026666 [Amblyomma americanum]|uniref:Uncharacterized protein n=1 Tax=Amblyomma americanum TaxID=6943 RepID=A0AAQ4DHX7_AMBAM